MNVCRVCVVEVEGSRVLVPSCSRKVEPGMVVKTDSERVKHSRKMVLEFLASSVDLSTTPDADRWLDDYGCRPERYGPPAPPSAPGVRDSLQPGHHEPPSPDYAATVAQPMKVDNELYVRDYTKCVLCYKCVEACGKDYQNTYALTVAGRGFDARISTEFAVKLPDSACVYCGNCIAVCPDRGADVQERARPPRRRAPGTNRARPSRPRSVPTAASGCTLELHVQDNEIVKVTSPLDHDITRGQSLYQGQVRLEIRAESSTRCQWEWKAMRRR